MVVEPNCTWVRFRNSSLAQSTLKPILQRKILLVNLTAAAAVVAGLGCIGWPILRER